MRYPPNYRNWEIYESGDINSEFSLKDGLKIVSKTKMKIVGLQ